MATRILPAVLQNQQRFLRLNSNRISSLFHTNSAVRYRDIKVNKILAAASSNDTTASTSDDKKKSEFIDKYRKVMASVPNPVVVVTTALHDDDNNQLYKRGVTCASFTSVSLNPPVVSFAFNRPSRMHDLLLKTGRFAVHVLGQDQVDYGIHFSQPAKDGHDQFETIPHAISEQGNPLIDQAVSVLECVSHSVHLIGDHNVWYGQVEQCSSQSFAEPLIYFARSYRSVSDELLMRAFETTKLPFEEWTHNAHLRMAWNYIQEYGMEKAVPLIKDGIRKYNEKNRHRIERGYHETVTMFFILMVNSAINKSQNCSSFEEFIECNAHLADSSILFQYYSPEALNSPQARQSFVPPDKKELQ